jgi:hypothetical protein
VLLASRGAARLFAFAYLWQLLPQPLALRFEGVPKFASMFVATRPGRRLLDAASARPSSCCSATSGSG